MNNSILYVPAFALALVAAPVALPSVAQAAANERIAFCRELLELPLLADVNFGRCVSIVSVEDNYWEKGSNTLHAAAVKECQVLPLYAPDFYDSFASNAECIAYFEEILE